MAHPITADIAANCEKRTDCIHTRLSQRRWKARLGLGVIHDWAQGIRRPAQRVDALDALREGRRKRKDASLLIAAVHRRLNADAPDLVPLVA